MNRILDWLNLFLVAVFNARIVFSRGRFNDWTLILLGTFKPWRRGPFTRGAGYINGFTIYLGRNVVGREYSGNSVSMYQPRPWRFGITRNGNLVPWTRH